MLLLPHFVIMTQCVFQFLLRLVYHENHIRSHFMLIFVRVKLTNQVTIGSFCLILCWRLIQTKNMIMQFITLLFLIFLNNLLKNNSFCSCVNTVWLRVRSLHIFVPGWVLGLDSGFAPALTFCLVNTISNAWSSYQMPDLLRIGDVANHTDQTWTKGLYIPRKFYGYSVYT